MFAGPNTSDRCVRMIAGCVAFAAALLFCVAPATAEDSPHWGGSDGGQWVLPTSWADPENLWVEWPLTGDASTASYAADQCNRVGNGPWLYLYFDQPVTATKLLVVADCGFGIVDKIDIETSDGIPLYSDAVANDTDAIIAIPYTPTPFTGLRFRFHYLQSGYYFWLYKLAAFAKPAKGDSPEVSTTVATSVTTNSAALHATITNDGGDPCQVRFQYRPADVAEYTVATDWTGAISTGNVGSAVLLPSAGLRTDVEYWFRAQAKNGYGISSGQELSFKLQPIEPGSIQWLSANGISLETTPGSWDVPEHILDDDVSTMARSYHALWTNRVGPYVYLDLPEIEIDQMRFMAGSNPYIASATVEIQFEDGSWTTVYDGPFGDRVWTTFGLPRSVNGIFRKARVHFDVTTEAVGTAWELYELQVHPSVFVSFVPWLDLTVHAPTHIELPLQISPSNWNTPITVRIFAEGSARYGVHWRFSDVPVEEDPIVPEGVASTDIPDDIRPLSPPRDWIERTLVISPGSGAPSIGIDVLSSVPDRTLICDVHLSDTDVGSLLAPTFARVRIADGPSPPPFLSFADATQVKVTSPGHVNLPLRLQSTWDADTIFKIRASGTAVYNKHWRFSSIPGMSGVAMYPCGGGLLATVVVPAGSLAPAIGIDVLTDGSGGPFSCIFELEGGNGLSVVAPSKKTVTIGQDVPVVRFLDGSVGSDVTVRAPSYWPASLSFVPGTRESTVVTLSVGGTAQYGKHWRIRGIHKVNDGVYELTVPARTSSYPLGLEILEKSADDTLSCVVNITGYGTGEVGAPASVTVNIAPNLAPTLTSVNTLGCGFDEAPFHVSYDQIQRAANDLDLDGGPSRISFAIEQVLTGTLRVRDIDSSMEPRDVAAGEKIGSTQELYWTSPRGAQGIVNAFTIKAYDGMESSASPVTVPISVCPVRMLPATGNVAYMLRGRLAHWRLDDDVYRDASGFTRSLSAISEAAGEPAVVWGMVGRARQLDSVHALVAKGAGDYLNFRSALSMTMFFKSKDLAHVGLLGSGQRDTVDDALAIGFDGEQQLVARITTAAGPLELRSHGLQLDFTWHHLALSMDATRVAVLIDGVEVASGVGDHMQLRDVRDMFVGLARIDGQVCGGVAMDDIRIFGRTLDLPTMNDLRTPDTPIYTLIDDNVLATSRLKVPCTGYATLRTEGGGTMTRIVQIVSTHAPQSDVVESHVEQSSYILDGKANLCSIDTENDYGWKIRNGYMEHWTSQRRVNWHPVFSFALPSQVGAHVSESSLVTAVFGSEGSGALSFVDIAVGRGEQASMVPLFDGAQMRASRSYYCDFVADSPSYHFSALQLTSSRDWLRPTGGEFWPPWPGWRAENAFLSRFPLPSDAVAVVEHVNNDGGGPIHLRIGMPDTVVSANFTDVPLDYVWGKNAQLHPASTDSGNRRFYNSHLDVRYRLNVPDADVDGLSDAFEQVVTDELIRYGYADRFGMFGILTAFSSGHIAEPDKIRFEQLMRDGLPLWRDSDGDGLTDREELALGSMIDNRNSNSDWVGGPGSLALDDALQASIGEDPVGPAHVDHRLPSLTIRADASGNDALLSWNYADSHPGESSDSLPVQSQRVYEVMGSNPATDRMLGVQPANRSRWLRVPGLTAGVDHVFRIEAIGRYGDLVQATSGAIRVGTGIHRTFSVSNLTASAESERVHLQWGFDPTLAVGDGIGFLIYRRLAAEPPSSARLVAALPMDLAGSRSLYGHADGGLQPSTDYLFDVVVIDQDNNRSAPTALTVTTAAAATPRSGLTAHDLVITTDGPRSDWSANGIRWTGSHLGSLYQSDYRDAVWSSGWSVTSDAGVPVLRMPVAPSAAYPARQYFQSIVPDGRRSTVRFVMRMTGSDRFSTTGTTVLEFLDTSSEGGHGRVGKVILSADRIIVGDRSGSFYHGDAVHDYVLVREDGDVSLTVDGFSIPLARDAQAGGVETQADAERPFIRFGAVGGSATVATLWHALEFSLGVTELLPAGVPLPLAAVPAPSGLEAQAGAGGIVTLAWTGVPQSQGVSAYRVTLDEDAGFVAVVPNSSSAMQMSMPFTVPGTYHARVQAVNLLGRVSAVVGPVAFIATERSEAVVVTAELSPGSTTGWSWTGLGSPIGANGWRAMAGATATLSAPAETWSAEIEFALRVDTTSTPAVTVSSPLLRFLDPTAGVADTVLSIDAGQILLSGPRVQATAPAYPGGASHVLRVINCPALPGDPSGSGMCEVRIDDRVVLRTGALTISGVQVRDQTGYARRMVVALGSTGSSTAPYDMRPLALGLAVQQVPEFVIAADNSGFDQGLGVLHLAWNPTPMAVSAFRLRGIGPTTPVINHWAVAGDQIFPTSRLDPASGSFVAINGVSLSTTDRPAMPFAVQAVPLTAAGSVGRGSAQSYLLGSSRQGGSVQVIGQPPFALGSGWTLQRYGTEPGASPESSFALPHFTLPGVSVRTGTQAILAQEAPATGCFSRPLDASGIWTWSGYVDLDAQFVGTLLSVTGRTAGTGIRIDLKKGALKLVSLTGPVVTLEGSANDIITLAAQRTHKLELSCVPSWTGTVITGSTIRLQVDDAADLVSTVVVPVICDATSRLSFGHVAFADMAANAADRPATPIAWRRITSSVSGQQPFTTAIDVAGGVAGWTWGGTAPQPAMQEDPSAAFTHLDVASCLGYQVATASVNGLWSLQFTANMHGSDPSTCSISPAGGSTAIVPLESGVHAYRIVGTPGSALVYVDGRLRGSIPLTAAPVAGQFDLIEWSNHFVNAIPPQPSTSLDLIGDAIFIAGAIDADDVRLKPIAGHITTVRTAVIDPGTGFEQPQQAGYLFLHGALTGAGSQVIWTMNTERNTDVTAGTVLDIGAPVRSVYQTSTGGRYGVNMVLATNPTIVLGSTLVTVPPPTSQQIIVAEPAGITLTPDAEQIGVAWSPVGAVDGVLVRLIDPQLGPVALANGEPQQFIAAEVQPIILSIPAANRGRLLELTLTARRTVAGRPWYSAPVTVPVSTFDTRSVDLADTHPTTVIETGDRLVDLTLADHAPDTAGYVVWCNQPGADAAAASRSARILACLDRAAVARIQALQLPQRSLERVTAAQASVLRELLPQTLLPTTDPYVAPVFFFHPDKPARNIRITAVGNATQVTQPARITLDPWDDGVPAVDPQAIPVPNLGSQEDGTNAWPAAEVNTRTVEALTANADPHVLASAIMLSYAGTTGQASVPTVGEVLQQGRDQGLIPSWIVNNVDATPLLIAGADRARTFALSGPRIGDRSLTAAELRVGTGAAVASVTRAHVFGSEDDVASAAAPFAYDLTHRLIAWSPVVDIAGATVLQSGYNSIVLHGSDADGATSAVQIGQILLDDQAPAVVVQQPAAGSVIGLGCTIAGSFSEDAGISALRVRVAQGSGPFGEPLAFTAGQASVQHGYFSAQVPAAALPQAGGPVTLRVEMVDLAGNVSVPRDVAVVVSTSGVRCQVTVQESGALLRATVSVIGVEKPGVASSAPQLQSLVLHGMHLSVDALTVLPQADGQVALQSAAIDIGPLVSTTVVATATVSFTQGGAVGIQEFTAVDRYNGPEEPPQFISAQPDPLQPITTSLVDGQPRVVIAACRLRYVDTTPGIILDAQAALPPVQIEIPSITGLIDVTDRFTITSTTATLKPSSVGVDNRLILPVDDPRVVVTLRDGLGYATTVPLTYIAVPPEQLQEPRILATSPVILGRGLPQVFTLYGTNLHELSQLDLVTAAPDQVSVSGMRVEAWSDQAVIPGTLVEVERIRVRVAPIAGGLGIPRIGSTVFAAAGVLVTDVEDLDERDRLLQLVTDRTHDGRITVADLDLDGDGRPDRPVVPGIVDDVVDDPLDGVDPLVDARLAFDDRNDDGSPADSLIVVTNPRRRDGARLVTNGQLAFTGLVPADAQTVEVQLLDGTTVCAREVVSLAPSGRYDGRAANPLEFMTRSLFLNTLPATLAKVTVRILLTVPQRVGTPVVMLRNVELTIDRTPPKVVFAFLASSLVAEHRVFGFLSLWNQLTVEGHAFTRAEDYRISGSISDDQPLDAATFEVRLDNRTVHRDLFNLELFDNGRRATFTLLPERLLSISDRWADSTLLRNNLIGHVDLVYGVHHLQVQMRDRSGKTGVTERYFTFDHGPACAIRTRVTTSFSGDLADFTGSLKNRDPQPDGAGGRYALLPRALCSLDPALFPPLNDRDEHFLNLALGGYTAGAAAPVDGLGPMRVVLDTPAPPTWPRIAYAGGAIEQLQRLGTLSLTVTAAAVPPAATALSSSSTSGTTQTVTTRELVRSFPDASLTLGHGGLLDSTRDLFPSDLTSAPHNSPYTSPGLTIANSVSVRSSTVTTTIIIDDGGSGGTGTGGNGGGSGGSSGGWGGGGSGSGSTGGGTVVIGDGQDTPDKDDEPFASLAPDSAHLAPGQTSKTVTLVVGNTTPTVDDPLHLYGGGLPAGVISAGDYPNVPTRSGDAHATFTPRIPSIFGAAGGAVTDDHGVSYFYPIKWVLPFKLCARGFAMGSTRAGLAMWTPTASSGTDERYFIVASDPRPSFGLDERTLRVDLPTSATGTPTLTLDLLVLDPLARYSPTPDLLPVQVALNDAVISGSLTDRDPGRAGATSTHTAHFTTLPITVGRNQFNVRITSAIGQVTSGHVRVVIGDADGRADTRDDWFLAQATTDNDSSQYEESEGPYPLTIFGEFQGIGEITLPGAPNEGKFTIQQKDPRNISDPQRRYRRDLLVMGNQPAEGHLLIPNMEDPKYKDPKNANETAKVKARLDALPMAFALPGDQVTASCTEPGQNPQRAPIFVEGACFMQNTKTQRLQRVAADDLQSPLRTVTVQAYGRASRTFADHFRLTIVDAAGVPVQLSGTSSEIDLPVAAPAAGVAAFNGDGRQVTSQPLVLVNRLPDGQRTAQVGSELHLRLELGERLVASIDAPADGPPLAGPDPSPLGTTRFRARALVVLPPLPIVSEAVTGVTPAAGRNLPVPWFDVDAAIEGHSQQFRLEHNLCSVPGRMLPFAPSITYRSGQPTASVLGTGWTASWEACFRHVPLPPDATGDPEQTDLIRHGPDGREDRFAYVEAGTWRAAPGFAVQVVRDMTQARAAVLTMTDSDGTAERYEQFRAGGPYLLTAITDRWGNRLRVVRGAGGVPDKLGDDRGRTYDLRIRNTAFGDRLDEMIDVRGRRYAFRYVDGRLRGVQLWTTGSKAKLLQEVGYDYDTAGERDLNRVILPGSPDPYLTVSYDGRNATTLIYGLGGMVRESIWTQEGAVTRHTDTNGVIADWTFETGDGRTMLCAQSVQAGTTIATTYNEALRPLTQTGPTGTETIVWKNGVDANDLRGSDRMVSRTRTPAANGATSTIPGVGDNAVEPLVESWVWNTHPGGTFFLLASATSQGVTTGYQYPGPHRALRTGEKATEPSDIVITEPEQGGDAVTTLRLNAFGQGERRRSPAGALTVQTYYDPGNSSTPSADVDLAYWPYQTIQSTSVGHAIGDDPPARNPVTGKLPSDYLETVTSRDIWGRVRTVTSPGKAATITVYDDLGNVKEVEEPAVVKTQEAVANSHTRNISYFDGYNGRGFPWRAGRCTVDLAATAKPEGRSNGKLPLLPYEFVVLEVQSLPNAQGDRDGLDRPLTLKRTVQLDEETQTFGYETNKERVKWVKGYDNLFTVFEYDSAGRIEKTLYGAESGADLVPTTKDSRQERVVRDAAGNVTDRFVKYGTTAEIWEEHNVYDGFGRLLESKAVVSGRTSRRVHDPQGRVAGEESVDGADAPISRYKYTYEAASGALTATEDKLRGTTTTHFASEKENKQIVTDPLGRASAAYTDGAGRGVGQFTGLLNASREPTAGLWTARAFDVDGNAIAESSGSGFSDANGHFGNLSLFGKPGYDGKAPWRLFNPSGLAVQQGQPELGSDAVQDYAPSGFGSPALTVDEANNRVAYRHDALGQVVSQLELGTGKERLTRMGTHRASRRTVSVQYGMTNTPNQKSRDQAVVTTHDKMGRPISEKRYSGKEIRDTQPALGDVSASALIGDIEANSTPPLELVTEYDVFGRITKKTLADASVQEFKYYPDDAANPNDRRQLKELWVTWPGGHTLQLMRALENYDRFGQPKKLSEYQTEGGLVVLQQARGAATNTTPNLNHGMLNVESVHVYDKGKNAQNEDVWVELDDDPDGRPVQWDHDAAGKLTKLSLPSRAKIGYDYLNQTWPLSATLTPFGSTATTEVWKVTERNGFQEVTKEQRWDAKVALEYTRTGLEHSGLIRSAKLAGGTIISSADYDERGLRTKEGLWPATAQTWARQYGYDGLGRLDTTTPLISTDDPFGLSDFRLDGTDNRTKDTKINGTSIEYTVGSYGRYGTATLPSGTDPEFFRGSVPAETPIPTWAVNNRQVAFSWSTTGLLIGDTFFGYSYDRLGRCYKASRDPISPTEARYYLDALGRRVFRKEIRPGTAIAEQHFRVVYDGDLVVEEYRRNITAGETVSKQVSRSHYNADGVPVAHETWAPITNAYMAYVIATDDQGSVAGVQKSTSTTMDERFVYGSTGLAKGKDNAALNGSALVPFGWQGMYREPMTGHLRMAGKDYNPLHARRYEEDPGFVKMGFGERLDAATRGSLTLAGTAIGVYGTGGLGATIIGGLGIDSAAADFRTAWSGIEGARSFTHQALTGWGLSESAAGWTEFGIGMAAGSGGLLKATAGAAGRGVAAGGRAAWQGAKGFASQWEIGWNPRWVRPGAAYSTINPAHFSPWTIRRASGARNVLTDGAAVNLAKPGSGGRLDYTGHPDLFPAGPGQKSIVRIKYTGRRSADFEQARELANISRADQANYTWHHMADYDPTTNSGTMQLIRSSTHGDYAHSGGVAQWAAKWRIPYDLTKDTLFSVRAAGHYFPHPPGRW